MAGIVLVGVSGWSCQAWRNALLAGRKGRAVHPVEYLSSFVDVLEIDSTFRAPLKPEIATLWAKKAEANQALRFTARLSSRFTHARELDEAAAAQFSAGLRPLLKRGRLGALLMQFPWSFRFTAENREYLIRLRRMFHEFPLVAELRHNSWLLDEAQGVLIDYRVGFCNLDQPAHAKAVPPTAILTSATGFARLHGRDRTDWFADYDKPDLECGGSGYLYSREELEDWRERVSRVARHAEATYVTFTNAGKGEGLVNALQMRAVLASGAAHRHAPPALIRAFPDALPDYSPTSPVQPLLFEKMRRAA